ERIAVPRLRFARCRLNIEMVVDGQRRRFGAGIEAAMDDRESARFDDRGLAAEVADGLYREVSTAADVALPRRIRGHGRDLDELLESSLEIDALARGEGQQRLL